MIVKAGQRHIFTAIQKPGHRTIHEWLVKIVNLISCYAEYMGHDRGDSSARSKHPHSLAGALIRYDLCQCPMYIAGILGPAL